MLEGIINENHKLLYYRGLKEYKAEKGYLLDTCRSAQDVYEKNIEYFFQTEVEAELVKNITKLLLELGTGFAFVGN